MTRKLLPYLVATAIYAVLAVAYHFTVAPLMQMRRNDRSSPARRYYMLNDQVMALNAQYQRMLVRDSIVPLIPDKAGAFVQLPISDTARGYLERRFDQLVSKGTNAALGVIAVPGNYGNHPAIKDHVWRTQYYFGVKDNTPYCVWTIPMSERTIGKKLPVGIPNTMNYIRWNDPVAGPCRLWGKYGGPSQTMLAWLDQGGGRFATSPQLSNRLNNFRWYSEQNPVTYFLQGQHRWYASLDGQRCLAGDLRVCESVLLRPASNAELLRYGYWRPALFAGDNALLGGMERRFGSERFARFWHSKEPLPQAFQAAFGMPLGKWVQNWGVQMLGPLEAGPSLGGGTLLISLIIIVVFVGIAVGVAQRRTI